MSSGEGHYGSPPGEMAEDVAALERIVRECPDAFRALAESSAFDQDFLMFAIRCSDIVAAATFPIVSEDDRRLGVVVALREWDEDVRCR